MEPNEIHIIFHPTSGGYAGYSQEIDGLNTEAKTVEELVQKIVHLVEVRAEALAEIGHSEEAQRLRNSKIVMKED